MLVEVTFVRDARSVTQITPETIIASDNVVAGAFIREPRAVFSEGILTGHAGATRFIELLDVPGTYAGSTGKLVSVKSTEDGLEFTSPPTGAPTDAHYLTTQSESGLTNEFSLGGLGDGLLKQSVVSGVATPAIAAAGTDYVDPSDSRLTNDRTANALRTLNAKAIDNAADPTDGQVLKYDAASGKWKPATTPAVAAPPDAHYLTTQSESGLSNEFNLGGLSSGLLRQSVTTGVATPAIAAAGTDYVDPSDTRLTNDRTANALRTLNAKAIDNAADPTDGQVLKYDGASGKWKPATTPAAVTVVRNFTFGLRKTAGIATGKLPMFWTCPFAGTITHWNITVDAGTITVKIWKIATGTAKPTSANSINTSGISLSTGTAIRSATLTDFTTLAVAVGDIFAAEVTAVSGVTDFEGAIEITQS
jgi:hypothetical protein